MRLPMIRREDKKLETRPIRSIFDDFLHNAFSESGFEDTKLMAIDVIEREDEISLKADLPGIKKKDIKVFVEGENLVIEARREEQKEERDETMYKCERYSGDYRRVFTIPENWDYENMKAKFDHGVLHLEIPKRAKTPEKEITIK